MDKVIDFKETAVDFDLIVDEVDLLVPRYLEALDQLAGADDYDMICNELQNTATYWKRLTQLFHSLEPFEQEIPFRNIMLDTLQTELNALEKVYLKVNMRIEFGEVHWSKAMWRAASRVLERMDAVLSALGFSEEHQDRKLVQEMRDANRSRYEKWLLRARTT